MPPGIYHERQVAQMCGLHALNNLYQRPAMFTKEHMTKYCYELTPRNRTWPNPHQSWLGWGNYDVNVMIYAVQQRNCQAIWFDRRRDPSCLNLNAIFGFIMNIDSTSSSWMKSITYYLPIMMRSRHWIALRRIDNNYYNLDSKLTHPRRIGNDPQFFEYLRHQLFPDNDHELFIIMMTNDQRMTDNEEEEQQLWLKPQFRNLQESNE